MSDAVFHRDCRILVAGATGMVGSAIVRCLGKSGYENIDCPSREQLNYLDATAVDAYFAEKKFDAVFLAAAKVGGILANDSYPAEFIYDNLQIQLNIIGSSHRNGVKRLLFLGSSCIYPKYAEQPIVEGALLSGQLEPTNEPYAISKIAGIKLCESFNRQYGCDFRSLMPTNLYGPGDNFNPDTSHVVPALLRRFDEARQINSPTVTVWGSGKPMREFLYVDDLADACLHFMQLEKDVLDEYVDGRNSQINIGTGEDLSIAELTSEIASVTAYEGNINWDTAKPDGTPRKLLDVSLARNMGWQATTSLKDGLAEAYGSYLQKRKSDNLRDS